MSKKYQGIFIFEEWLEALNHMSPRMAMTIINNVYGFIRDGSEPERLRGSADLVQSLMLAHTRRSKVAVMYGRMGAEAKRRKTTEQVPRGYENDPYDNDFYDNAMDDVNWGEEVEYE